MLEAKKLSDRERRAFYRDGYIHVPRAVSSERVEHALSLINADLGKGIDPTRIAEFYARSFCPSLRDAPAILDLYEATAVRSLADALVAEGGLRTPSMAQIALRFPGVGPALLPRPHVDGTYGPSNGVPAGHVAHFTLLAMVALSDIDTDFAGNFTVWPGSHHAYERYFQSHDPSEMIAGTPRLHDLPAPVQIRAKAGDLLLCHYQLGHAAAPNLATHVRYAVFFRLYHRDHDAQGLDILADIWREYPSLQAFATESR